MVKQPAVDDGVHGPVDAGPEDAVAPEADAPAFGQLLEAALLPLVQRLDRLERQNRLLMRHLLMPRDHEYRGLPQPHPNPAPAVSAFPHSTVCRAKHFREPWFTWWTQRLAQGLRYHRKLWEFV